MKNKIKELYKMGMKQTRISKELGCSKAYVSQVINGKNKSNPLLTKKYYWKLKRDMMKLVGKADVKCVYCGCDDIRVLEFNHIEGGGRKWMKKHKMPTIVGLKQGLVNPDEIEITCKLCNHLHYLLMKSPDKAKRFKITWIST